MLLSFFSSKGISSEYFRYWSIISVCYSQLESSSAWKSKWDYHKLHHQCKYCTV